MTCSTLPVRLMCEYAYNPIGIDTILPRFSWQVADKNKKRGVYQKAYQILVASSRELLCEEKGDLWDSGRVESNESICIEYKGKPLKSGQQCWWSVRLWDNDDIVSDFADPVFFEMGLLEQSDWDGCFIGFPAFESVSAQFFRHEFTLDSQCVKARAYVCVPGYFELYVNGIKIGDHVLDPGTTDYAKTLLYVTHDITKNLRVGENVLVVLLGNGWYKNPRFLLQCNIELSDGTRKSICSRPDDSWTASTFPISHNDIYDGETYDSRFERTGWNQPGPAFRNAYPQKYWHFVSACLPKPDQDYNKNDCKEYFFARYRPLMLPSPGGRIRAQMMEPIKVIADVRPKSVNEPLPGVYVFDMGENMAGWIRIRLHGPRGSLVTIKYAEILYDNGTVNRESLNLTLQPRDMQCDRYVLRGEGEEIFEPRFTYHGFRFVQIEGLSFKPTLDTVIGRKVRSSVASIGEFSCSDSLLNQIHENIRRTEECNLHSIPTDCPQRDERHGWLNDMTVRAEEAVYNYMMNNLYHKWVGDIVDSQDAETGAICDTAPFRRGLQPGAPVSSSFLVAAWLIYEHYGNKRVLETYYDRFVKWAEYISLNSIDDIVNFGYWGDWCPPKEYGWNGGAMSAITPSELVDTAYSFYNFSLLEKMAEVLGKAEDQKRFCSIKNRIADSFNRHFLNTQTCSYAKGSQSSNAIAVYMGIAPEDYCTQLVKNIVDDIHAHNMHLTSGNQCTRYILEVLSEYGYCDDAVEIMTQTDYPSFGYMIKNGATTIWERWEYESGRSMNSHNHPMFGSVDVWFYKYLAGIRTDYSCPAFGHIIFKPKISTKLDYVKASINTMRGPVKSMWEKKDGLLKFTVSVPPNCTASVYLPLGGIPFERVRILEGNQVLLDSCKVSPIDGIRDVQMRNNCVLAEIGSGEYTFIVIDKNKTQ